MTQAGEDFMKSIHDAEIVLGLFDVVAKEKGGISPDTSDVLKRAALILAMTSWETYMKDFVRECVSLRAAELEKYYSPAAQELCGKLEKELKHFSNPNEERSTKLLSDYVGLNIKQAWSKTQTKLDDWVAKRGVAAHEAPKRGKPHPHLIDKNGIKKIITGLKKLVEATEAELAKV